MNALTFNQVYLNPVSQPDNQIWITAVDLAKALGYKKADAVTQIYKRNEDEFPLSMAQTLKLSVCGENKGLQRNIRIFSLRGCHLVAMFAKTAVAKQFRKWVLDLIENEANKLTGRSTTRDDRTGLRNAVNAIVSKKGLLYPDAYRLVHQRFNVEHIDELTLEQVGEATEYLHRLMLGGEKSAEAISERDTHNLVLAAQNMDWIYQWYQHYKPALKHLNPRAVATIDDSFGVAWVYLVDFGKRNGMKLLDQAVMKHFPWGASYDVQSDWHRVESIYIN